MIRRSAVTIVLIAILVLLAGCAGRSPAPASSARNAGSGLYKVGQPYQIDGTWYYPAEDFAYDETGIASWYLSLIHI